MTKFLLDYAKKEWIEGKFEAYELARTTKKLDPYFLNVDKIYSAYKVDCVEETNKNKLGQTDLYGYMQFLA